MIHIMYLESLILANTVEMTWKSITRINSINCVRFLFHVMSVCGLQSVVTGTLFYDRMIKSQEMGD